MPKLSYLRLKRRQKTRCWLAFSVIWLTVLTIMFIWTIKPSQHSTNFLKLDWNEAKKYRFALPKLTPDVIAVLKCAGEFNIDLFVIDPDLLLDIIDPEERDHLFKYHLLPNLTVNDNYKHQHQQQPTHVNVFSLGIFEDDIVLTKTTLKNHLELIGFEMRAVRMVNFTPDGSKFTVHFLVKNEDVLIQIVVFYKQDQMFWSGKIRDPSLDGLVSFFGKTEQAFDQFSVKSVEYYGLRFLVPNDTSHFLSQIHSSRYVECDKETALWFRDNFKNFSRDDWEKTTTDYRVTNWKVQQAIVAMKKLTKKLMMPFWMAGTTLLGWYRSCTSILNATSADFATWSTFASDNLTDYLIRLRKISKPTDLTLKTVFGFPDQGLSYQFSFKLNASDPKSNFTVNLSFVYPSRSSKLYSTTVDRNRRAFSKHFFPKFDLCSAEFADYRVLVPCRPEQYLEAAFGTDWRYPKVFDENWRAPNQSPRIYWADKFGNRSVVDFD